MRADRAAPTALSLTPEKPFRFIAGDASVDFVNTVDWTARGLENERMTDYQRFIDWARAADVVSDVEARRLRARARGSPRREAAAYRSALWARSVLQRLYSALATETFDRSALRDFNDLLADALARMQLAQPAVAGRRRADGARPLVRSWRGMGEELESPLRPVMWQACALLTSPDLSRLRICAAEDCGWMYVDRSRNGLRRWCQMETCGTREKNRRRADASGD